MPYKYYEEIDTHTAEYIKAVKHVDDLYELTLEEINRVVEMAFLQEQNKKSM